MGGPWSLLQVLWSKTDGSVINPRSRQEVSHGAYAQPTRIHKKRTAQWRKHAESDAEAGPLGATASLDEIGFRAVVSLQEPMEMEDFVRRAVRSLGLKVTDEVGLRD